jgi:3,4-dihydroxy 2-butanone 4-phosphate synthase/GTP cyclohydrolase II
MVIVVDDADRENEGDFVMAAEHVTAQTINFMATVGRGLICVPMRTDVLDALEIPPAVAVNTDPKRTAFRVAVDHATLTTTGISASDRANTIRALVDPASRAGDFTRPGHVFPLGYTQGGVLARPGHTEAAVDLAELAGLTPAGVICEICSSDGEMARLPELLAIGRRYGLPVLTIADLIAHRRRQLGKVTRAGEARLPLPAGEFRAIGFVDGAGGDHVALVLGDLTDGAAPLISIHSECLLGDVFGSRREQLEYALSAIAEHGRGAVIYLRRVEGGGARDIAAGHAPDEHAHQVADAILSNLGARRFRLLSDDGTNTGRARSA